jgi:iron complex outermembrane receptor protein
MKKQQVTGSGMKRLALSVTFLASSLAPLTTYGADGVLKGRVTDKSDGEGVVGAAVSIAGTNIATATDIDGNFVLKHVPSKQQKVSVSSVGYAPTTQVITVGDGQTATLNFALGQTTIMASEVVVGAALYKQDRLSIPVTANVVSKEKIKQEPNPTLDAVVQDVPGVVVSRAGGTATSSLQIRGSNTYQGGGIGTRVNAFYDGFPINCPDSGEIVWQSVNMNAADKVEVLKGAAATLYGSGAMGGVVNVTGHSPEKREIRAGSSIGFYDAPPTSDQSAYRKNFTPVFWNTYAGYGEKNGKWTYDLLYSHSDDQGYRQNAWNYMNDVKFKARYDINSKQYIQLSSFYNSTVGGYAYTWPYHITGNPLSYIPHPENAYDVYTYVRGFDYATAYPMAYTSVYNSAYASAIAGGFTPAAAAAFANTIATGAAPAIATAMSTYQLYDVYWDDMIKRKNALVGLNYVNLLSDNLSLDTRLYYTYNTTRYEYNTTGTPQTYPTGNPLNPTQPVTKNPGAFNETSDNRYGVGAKLDWRASDAHRLLFGLDGNMLFTSTTQVAAQYPVTNQFNDIQEKNFAAFLQDEWKMSDKLTALMSLRYDWSGINKNQVQDNVGVWTPINNKSVDALSPRIALNYKLNDETALRASWGRSFRAPTLYERFIRQGGIFTITPNPNLDKETMTAWEAGIFKQFNDQVSVDVAGFVNNYHDLIESRPITNNSLTYQYRNIPKARICGIETSLNYRPANDLTITGGYTFMYAKNLSFDPTTATTTELANPHPDWLPYRHTASANVAWKATSKLTVNLNGRYMSKYKAVTQFTNPQGSWYPGDFVVFNAAMKYQFTKNISATLACNNINNTQYQEAEWFMAPGRSYVAGIDLSY